MLNAEIRRRQTERDLRIAGANNRRGSSLHSAFIILHSSFPLLRLHVVAQQDVLIAQVQLAAGDDRVRPATGLAAVGLIESAAFVVAGRRRVDEHDGARAVLLPEIEVTLGVADRAFAGGA